MNKLLTTVGIVSLLALQVNAGMKVEVSPYFGKKLEGYSKDAVRFDDGKALLGIKANVYVKEHISIQLAAESSKENKMGDGGETDIERVMLNGVYDFAKQFNHFTPYAYIGAGYENLNRKTRFKEIPAKAHLQEVESQVLYDVGVGAKYHINERVNVSLESRMIYKKDDKDKDFIGIISVGYLFGPVKKAMTLREVEAKTKEKQLKQEIEKVVVAKKKPVKEAPKVVSQPVQKEPVKEVVVQQVVVEESPKTVSDMDDGGIPIVESIPLDEGDSYTPASLINDTGAPSPREQNNVQEMQEADEPNIIYDSGVVDCQEASGCHQPSAAQPVSSDLEEARYYVQVMAMKEHDTDVILGRLSMEGYHSILKQDSGLVRVLVGPYASRAEAKETLKALQQIQKDSYIIKLR